MSRTHVDLADEITRSLPGWRVTYTPREYGWTDLEGYAVSRPPVVRMVSPAGHAAVVLDLSTRRVGVDRGWATTWSDVELRGRGWVQRLAREVLDAYAAARP